MLELLAYNDIIEEFSGKEYPFPENAELSLPVSIMRGDKQYDAVFAFSMDDADTKSPTITRPFAWMMFPVIGGPDMLYSWCRVLDFVPTESYPLDSVVSNDLPKALSPRRIQALRSELLDVYEALREFAFEENLNRDQVEIIVKYKDLFLKLCYSGLYPFYHALSPGFFHWLRLPLPEMKSAKIKGNLEPAKEYQYQLLILENLKQLVDQFQQKIMVDQHKQQLFDEMHYELQRYRNGMLDHITLAMERDVIQLIDSLGRSLRVYEDKEGTPEDYQRMLAMFDGVRTDLQDILYRHGVDPYHETGDEVHVSRQKVIATIPTGNSSLDRRIAARLSPGWEKGGKVIRPEHVSVYLYENSADEKSGDGADS